MISKDYPSGLLTILFSDIEGSTPLWEADPAGMASALENHNNILGTAIENNHGKIFKTVGDELCVVFDDPANAVNAAIEGQIGLSTSSWGHVGPLKVRMGIHFGSAIWQGDDYANTHTFNRVARIMSCGHGGQILISSEVFDQVEGRLPEDVSLADMGRHRLKGMALREHLFQVCAPGLQKDFSPLNSEGSEVDRDNADIVCKLPQMSTPFIGRETELKHIEEMLSDSSVRLLTITGPGGIGKTRTALETARRRFQNYRNQACFVELASLTSMEQIIAAVADAVGLKFKGERDPEDQLMLYLGKMQALIVLDNFEHLLEGKKIASRIVASAPEITLLVTSRERLGLAAEHLYSLKGLKKGGIDERIGNGKNNNEAVLMFLSCARRVISDYQMATDEKAAVIEICHLIEGLPLAIELAAAWTRFLQPIEILCELKSGLQILNNNYEDVPSRHMSIQASFNYSWNLMNEKERLIMMKLSVFRGGFTFQSAKAVAGAGLAELVSLVDKSMIHRNRESGRYAIHELLRQIAEEHLEENGLSPEVWLNHARYYIDSFDIKGNQTESKHSSDSFEKRVKQELDNFRVAILRSVSEGEAETALKLAILLVNITELNWREEVKLLRDALQCASLGDYPALQAETLILISKRLIQEQASPREYDLWIGMLEKAIFLSGESDNELCKAHAFSVLGFAYLFRDNEKALDYYTRAVLVYEKQGIESIESFYEMCLIYTSEGDFEKAREYIQRVVDFGKKNKNKRILASIKLQTAYVEYYEGNTENAKGLAQDVLSYFSTEGMTIDHYYQFTVDGLLLDISMQEKNLNEASFYIRERLHFMKEDGFFSLAIFFFHQISLWFSLSERFQEAAFWLGCFNNVVDKDSQPVFKVEQDLYNHLMNTVTEALSKENYETSYRKGYNTTPENAVDLGLELF